MQNISSLLSKKQFEITKESNRVNQKFERAKEFGEYVHLHPLFVLRLFKLFGEPKVQSIRSWLKDIPAEKKEGLAMWKLKQLVDKSSK